MLSRDGDDDFICCFFFSSRRRHTRFDCDWSSDVCSSDLWIGQSFESRERLQAENARLRAAQRDLALRSMRYEALARENGELRGLRAALPPLADGWLAAQIVNIQLSSLRQRLLINRGAVNGVFKAQAVLDDRGLIGQTTHVGPWSAGGILITDPQHAVPGRFERTGLRTLASGAGDA